MQHKITDIEEMARDIANTSCPKKPCEECNWCGSASEAIDCTMFLLAEELYNEGYRKASEVAREISEAFRDEMRSLIATSKKLFNECEDDYYEGKKDAFFTAIIHLDELIKKKYTEGEG